MAYTVEDHLNALEAMAGRLKLDTEPVVLAGHSTGAVLALEWAAARPDFFRAVVLMSLPAYRSPAEARRCIASLSPLARATVMWPPVGKRICEGMCASRPFWRAVMPLLAPGVPADIARDYVLHDWRSYNGTLQNVLVHHHIAAAAARLAGAQVPVRLLHGGRDRAAPLTAVRALARQHGWSLSVCRGAGHHLLIDEPDTCAAALRPWLLAVRQRL